LVGNPVLGGNNLTLGAGITTINNTNTNYFQTNGTGKVIRTIPTGSNLLFPIGKMAYNPLSVENNTGAQDVFSVRVLDSVFLNGTTGPLITTPHVRVTWDISKTNPNADPGVDFEFGWNADQEVGSFSSYELNHYGPSWSFAVGTSNAPSGTTTKTMSHTGYTGTFSPFAISQGTSALPVELLSFTAQCEGNSVKLRWQTASELNSMFFDVEKSRDGINWTLAERVTAAGNSTQTLDYLATDIESINGVVYYRLNQLDLDGASKIYEPISAQCESDVDFSAVLFPNPSSGKLTIEINNTKAQNVHIQICGTDGKSIMEGFYTIEAGITQVPFNLEILNAGMYTVKVQGESDSKTMKVVLH
jgi:hypothetical protein